MMLIVLTVLVGATMVLRRRVTGVSRAAGLKPATVFINRQVLTLAVMLLSASMPTVRIASGAWLPASP